MSPDVFKIILVEGPHDAAFIARIMLANGYENPKTCMEQIEPPFIRSFIQGFFGKVNFKRDIGNASTTPLPSHLLTQNSKQGKELAVLFKTGGIDNIGNIKAIIGGLIGMADNPFGQQELGILKIKTLLNFDADDKGIEARIGYANNCIRLLTDAKFPGITDFGSTFYRNIKWGSFINADKTGYGSLEQLVWPLFEDGRHALSNDVSSIAYKRNTYNIPQTRAYNDLKAKIGMMGQLDMPGMSNTVLIGQSGMINDASLKEGIYRTIGEYISTF